MSLQDELDAFVIGDDLLEHDSSIEYDVPTDLDRVDRMLRLRAFLERQIAEKGEIAQRNIAQIGQWLDEAIGPMKRRLVDVDRALEGFARAQHDDDPRRKTFKLPAGTLSLRASQPRLIVNDAEQVAKWTIAVGLEDALVEWVPKIGSAAFKKVVVPGPASGEIDSEGFEPRRALYVSPGTAEACLVVACFAAGLTFTFVDLLVTFAEAVPGATLLVPTRPSFSIQRSSRSLDSNPESTGADE